MGTSLRGQMKELNIDLTCLDKLPKTPKNLWNLQTLIHSFPVAHPVSLSIYDFPGARKAVDDYLSVNKPSFFLEGPSGSAFLIK